jgi:hypothetical protein
MPVGRSIWNSGLSHVGIELEPVVDALTVIDILAFGHYDLDLARRTIALLSH